MELSNFFPENSIQNPEHSEKIKKILEEVKAKLQAIQEAKKDK